MFILFYLLFLLNGLEALPSFHIKVNLNTTPPSPHMWQEG